MRAFIIAAVAAISLYGLSATPVSAQNCDVLQRACEMKDQLGEAGQGNCRRFREECGNRGGGGGNRRGECRELRRACMFKNELGEGGRGNCKRYRETCQGNGRG